MGGLPIEETTELLGYLERFLIFSRGIPTLRVRLELQRMFEMLMKQQAKLIAKMKHDRPKSDRHLSLNDKDFSSWLVTNVTSLHIERIGSELWKNVFVQMLDHIANVKIEKKNILIIEELLNKYIPAL